MIRVVDVLLLAKDKLIDGWVPHAPRHADETNKREHCAVTAISYASKEVLGYDHLFSSGQEHATALNLMHEIVGKGSLGDWSDSGPKQKVIDGFDEAIRLAKERDL